MFLTSRTVILLGFWTRLLKRALRYVTIFCRKRKQKKKSLTYPTTALLEIRGAHGLALSEVVCRFLHSRLQSTIILPRTLDPHDVRADLVPVATSLLAPRLLRRKNTPGV